MLKSINRKKALAAAGIILAAVLCIFGIVKIFGAVSSHIRLRTADGLSGSFTLVAHRGMSALAPENTLEAAQKAAENGYKYIEFDVRRTKDGVWVISHDEDIERMTDGKGKIGELTYKQVLSSRVDTGANLKDYGLVTIPTLDDMLAKCGEYGLSPVIEIKESGTDCVEELLNFIGRRCSGEISIISFDRKQIELGYSLMMQSKTSLPIQHTSFAWLTNDLSDETLTTAKKNPKIGISFNANKAGSAEEINAFTKAGISLAAWTVDKPKRLTELYNMGIRRFTTNAIVYTLPSEESTK